MGFEVFDSSSRFGVRVHLAFYFGKITLLSKFGICLHDREIFSSGMWKREIFKDLIWLCRQEKLKNRSSASLYKYSSDEKQEKSLCGVKEFAEQTK